MRKMAGFFITPPPLVLIFGGGGLGGVKPHFMDYSCNCCMVVLRKSAVSLSLAKSGLEFVELCTVGNTLSWNKIKSS
jgi:hypothetical protein